MSLKHRNSIVWILILLASVCWTFGQKTLDNVSSSSIIEDTRPPATHYTSEGHLSPVTDPSGYPIEHESTETLSPSSEPEPEATDSYYETYAQYRSAKMLGFILSFFALAVGGIAILVFSQKYPICGPDGISFLFGLLATAYHIIPSSEYILWDSTVITPHILSEVIKNYVILISIREFIGWIRAKFSLTWCLVHRIAKRCNTPQFSLLTHALWLVLSLTGITCFFITDTPPSSIMYCIPGFLSAAVLGLLCLWRYGTDLIHLQKQLDEFQHGRPITVGEGAFSQTERQLLDLQAQHMEAVRTAVTSERFKVDLISNVSHDLRTPLTSILGYSELLLKENLSPDGREQLLRLYQKAGYMNDLVESLFELTKVSSGAVESKKDQIDLIRLLEQTIGLFDDQLTQAGLAVRRNYGADAIPVITDGARIHQVFANLLGNAIKYALAGTRIYIEVTESAQYYRVRMINTASYEMDFKPEEIMQRFARGDKARSTKGSGLGLAIAQTYSESVGGSFRISVDGDQFSAIVELPKN